MILFLHNRYRTTGGEERAVEELMWLARERLGEEVELLAADSAMLGRGRAAVAMLRGGLAPDDVGAAVRRTGARVVHAHNLNPAYGWRALAAGKAAGAGIVAHLHQYRLVCAIGVCYTRGEECTRCHGRNTLPGVALNCRGSRAEAVVYGAGLALNQRRLCAQVDVFAAPSAFAVGRLRELGAPFGERPVRVVPHVLRSFAERSRAGKGGYALVVSRLAPEKGVAVAVEACRRAGVALVVVGDGELRGSLEAVAVGADVRFVGAVSDAELASLRAGAAVAVVPSLSGETFGLAAAEAMAGGLPVAASAVGALSALVPGEWLVPPGDPGLLADAVRRLYGDAQAGEQGLAVVRSRLSAAVVGPVLEALYAEAAG